MESKYFFISKTVRECVFFSLDTHRIILVKISYYLFTILKFFIDIFLCTNLSLLNIILILSMNITKHSFQTLLGVVICLKSIFRIKHRGTGHSWFKHSSYFSIFKHLFIIDLFMPPMIFIIKKAFLYSLNISLLVFRS